MAKSITSYKEFWPNYLRGHSRPINRWFHYASVVGFIAALIYSGWTGNWWALLAAIPILYALAWFGHFMIERNTPATFTYPVWSLISDFRMFALGVTGRIGAEMEKHQIRPGIGEPNGY